jgi:hypothetical protein
MRIDHHPLFWRFHSAHPVWMKDQAAVRRHNCLTDELTPPFWAATASVFMACHQPQASHE